MSSPCCVDPGAKQVHQAQGAEVEIGGVKAYKTGNGKNGVIMFTDVFGFSFINARQIADSISENTGATVLILDYFHGDAMDPNGDNLLEKFPAWFVNHPINSACEIADKFFSTVEENFQTIQLIGFCYGAKIVVHFLMKENLPSKVKSAVVAHPSFLVEEEATKIGRPILFLCAENDALFLPELRSKFETALKENDRGNFVEFPGTTHGFVIRPDGSQNAEEQRQKAIRLINEYFNKKF